MTKVRFTFVDIQGNPLPLMQFKLLVRRASFNDADVGVTLPEEISVTTDEAGQAIVELWPLKTAYRIQVAEEYEECCGKLNWSFYVPHTDEIVEAQSLFLVPPPNNVPWDEEAIGKITQAVIDSHDSAVAAESSAVRAENAAQTIEGDADRAEAAAAAADASKNAAAVSAQASAGSATASGQSAADALASKNAAAVSQNAANNSAVSASGDAGRAAASATAAAGSATTATNAKDAAAASAAAALASKNSADTAAGTATTKAAEAVTSANNAAGSASTALTQANRAKTEADRAAAATDGKQPLNSVLTNLANAVWTANSFPLIAADKSVYVEIMSDEARLFNRQTTPTAMRSRLDLVKTTSNIDSTLGRVMLVGDFGMGGVVGVALPGASAQQALPNGRYYTASQWAGSPFNGLDGLNQGILDVATWADVNYTRQTWTPINPASAAPRTRYSVNGVWQPWVIDPTIATAANDPEALTGGLMYTTTVSGFSVHKYANGQICMLGGIPNSNTIAANTNGFWDISIPTLFSGAFPCVITASLGPSQVWDFSGACAYQLSANTVRVIVRNGSTAQYFSGLISMWGRWK